MSNPEIKVGQKYRVVDVDAFGYCFVSRGDILEVFDVEPVEDSDRYYGITEDEMIITPSEISGGIVEPVEEPLSDAPVFDIGHVWRIADYFGADMRQGDCVYIKTVEVLFGDVEAVAHKITDSEVSVILYESDVHEGRIEKLADSLHEYFTGEPMEASTGVVEKPATNVPEEVGSVSQESTEASTAIKSGHSAELIWKFIEGSGDYNGHKQFEINELPWDVLKESVKVLGEYLEHEVDTLASSLEIRLMYNGDSGKFAGTWGASVYQLDYWSDGEHRDGHKDRLLFGVEIVRGI